jgi:hypothetical protein
MPYPLPCSHIRDTDLSRVTALSPHWNQDELTCEASLRRGGLVMNPERLICPRS